MNDIERRVSDLERRVDRIERYILTMEGYGTVSDRLDLVAAFEAEHAAREGREENTDPVDSAWEERERAHSLDEADITRLRAIEAAILAAQIATGQGGRGRTQRGGMGRGRLLRRERPSNMHPRQGTRRAARSPRDRS